MEKSSAWEKGYRAFFANWSHFDNIFTAGSTEWTEWDAGWWDAAAAVEGGN